MDRSAAQVQLVPPSQDGQVLVVPEPERAGSDLQTNIARLGQGARVFGRELTALRKDVRLELQRELHIPESERIVAVGHQSSFHHCGILAKYYLADKLARDNNATVCNFVVDTDFVETDLLLPGKGEGGFVIRSLPLIVDRGELSAEHQVSPSSWELKRFREMYNSEVVIPSCQSAADELVNVIEKTARTTRTMAELKSHVNLEYSRRLGLARHDIPVSRLSDTPGFTWFVFNLLANSRQIWLNYNEAISDFMQERGITSSPIPQLGRSNDYLEMPFWLNLPGIKRQPLYFRPADGMIACGESEKTVGLKLPGSPEELHEQLQETALRIRPRTVTFTAYCRVFFADYFIHGTGGAYYDQVTDLFIGKAFGIEPPAYGCASATVLADFGFVPDMVQAGRNVEPLQQKLRDFHNNPQRYVSFRDNSDEVEGLLRQKVILVEKSNLLRDNESAHEERQVVFEEIRLINQAVCANLADTGSQIEHDLVQARKHLMSTQSAMNRELFFGLFSEERLRSVFAGLA